jgi:hypothetical protein
MTEGNTRVQWMSERKDETEENFINFVSLRSGSGVVDTMVVSGVVNHGNEIGPLQNSHVA